MDVKQTREAWAELAAVWIRSQRALQDGKITLAEKLGYLADWKIIMEAIGGIGDIPAEILDLDDNELSILRREIYDGLIAAGVTHRIADITDKIIEWVKYTIGMVMFIRNAPPTAIQV